MSANKFKNHFRNLESPPSVGFSITPNDSADLVAVTRAIMVGTSGNIKVDMVDADPAGNRTIILYNVAAGIPIPLSVTKVHSTDTTALNIVGLY